jgi:hypothetical protein
MLTPGEGGQAAPVEPSRDHICEGYCSQMQPGLHALLELHLFRFLSMFNHNYSNNPERPDVHKENSKHNIVNDIGNTQKHPANCGSVLAE